jgi:hypothetical protein
VRLLFEENLSPRLVDALSDEFPGSTHVREVGLEAAEDLLRRSQDAISPFHADSPSALLILG